MEYHSGSEEQQEEIMNDEEYRVSEYPTRQEARRELSRESRQSFKDRKKNHEDVEEKTEGDSPSISRSPKKIKKTKSKTKLEMSWVKLVFRIFIVAAVWYNFHFLLNYMKGPASNFTETLIVIGICAGVNLIAVWILFYKRAYIRFYLSLMAVIGSFAYYGYVNYTQHSFLGNNKITSLIVVVSVLMALNPRVYSFPRGIVFLLIPILGIYFSGNQFALVWTLMSNAGLILMFRKSRANKSKDKKSKDKKKEEQTRKNKKQTA